MTHIRLNPLTPNQRKLLQFGVILALTVFLAIFFISIKNQDVAIKNNTVYLQDGKLYLFDEVIPLNQYPDRIVFHNPYFVVVKPEQQKSSIYNLNTKRKESEVNQIILDYFERNSLSNTGKVSYFNGQDLGILCEKGFIKNSNEVLCITKINKDNVENKLISIDVNTKKSKEIYSSKNLLTDVSVINDVLYLGEIDTYTNKSYVLVNGGRILTTNIISLIYEMDGKPYFASYKSALNGQKESYYFIDQGKIIKQDADRVIFYR